MKRKRQKYIIICRDSKLYPNQERQTNNNRSCALTPRKDTPGRLRIQEGALDQDFESHGGPRLLSEEIPWFALVDLKMQEEGPFCCMTFAQAPETGHSLSERGPGNPGGLGNDRVG